VLQLQILRDLLKARGADTLAIDQNIIALQNQQKALQQQATEIPKVKTGMQGLRLATQQLKDMMKSMASEMANAFATAIMGALESGKSIGAALEAATSKILEQLATQALAKALYYTAEGIAAATMMNGQAPGFFAAAAEFALVAGAAGAAGIAMSGSGSGSGQSAAPSPGQTTSSSAGGGGTNQTGSVTKLAEGGIVSKPTMITPDVMAGDSRSGGSADEAILPLSDPSAMRQVANAIAPGGLPQTTPQEESGFDPESIKRMTEAISALTGTRDAAQEFHFAQPGTGEKPGFQFAGSTAQTEKSGFSAGGVPTVGEALGFTPRAESSPNDKPSFTAGGAPSSSEKPTFDTDRGSASKSAGFNFGAATPSVHDSAGFSSGEPSPGEKSSFSSGAPSETEKSDFLSSQPSVGEKPAFNAGSPTVGEALGFKFDTPYPGDKPVFSSGQPSAPEKPGFSLTSPSANDQRDFAASSPTVGDVLGFSFSAPRLSHEGLGFTSGQPSSTATQGFSSGVASPSEKPTLDFSQPSAGERPGFNYSAPSLPREMPDMESLAAQFGGLLSAPTLRAASNAQVPTAAVSASSSSQPVDIEGRMERFAEKMGEQSNPDNGAAGGDTTHVHLNVKGMISSDNLKKVVKKINLAVQKRHVMLKASKPAREQRSAGFFRRVRNAPGGIPGRG